MSLREVDAADLTRMLQVDGLPGLLISNRPLRDISDEAIQHLTRTNYPLYVRHGELVRVQYNEEGTPFIEPLSEPAFKGIVMRSMNIVKLTMKGPMHVTPPDVLIKDMLTIGSWPFPPLETIVEFPVFRPDGTLIDTPGYDVVTRLYYAPTPDLHIPPISQEPTPDDIVNAVAFLDEAIGDFPFTDKSSYANALGLLLTPIVRQSINGHVPLALIDATRPGTGKSLLAETIAMVATGRKAAMMTAPYDDDEWRKRIASTLAEGATIIIIDNVKAKIQSASLDAALTSSIVKERILGQSKNGVYPQRATWMATGNNIQVGGDMPRRSYWIRMDAHTDKPWTRGNFRHNLEEWVPQHRGELIAALLTIARAWYAEGKTVAPNVPRLGSFQQWADTVGGILAQTQLVDDFLGNIDQLYEQADEEAAQWAAFLHAVRDQYEEEEFLAATLAKDIKAGALDEPLVGVTLYNSLPDELADIHKGDFKRRLGKALSTRVGSQFDESGLHLERVRTDARSGAVYWRVAGMQVSQEAIPQKEFQKERQQSLEQAGGGIKGNIPHENGLALRENTPAKPAYLQGKAGEEDPEIAAMLTWMQGADALIGQTGTMIAQQREKQLEPKLLDHIKRLEGAIRVRTPQGEGTVIALYPYGVKVLIDRDGRQLLFQDLWHLERIWSIDIP